MERIYDAVVIGGGPGGSSAASYLSLAGRKVLVLEKEVFPRFHIGESLLPYNLVIFDELGVTPQLEAAAFPRKYGAQFELGDGSRGVAFDFRAGRFTRHRQAFQVERSKLDHILLNNTRRLGADVREGWTVRRADTAPDAVTVEASGPDGSRAQFRAAYVVDASGRGNVTANRDGQRVVHPHLKKLSVFGHFYNVALDAGDRRGDTIVTRLNNKWFWFIPISAEKTSVGCVIDKDEFARWPGTPEELFQSIVASSKAACRRMKDSRPAGPMQTTTDFSYHNRCLAEGRLIRVGDAAGFLDPIFSSGVYVAMLTGKLASAAILETMRSHSSRPFARYQKKVFAALKFYREMVEGFYTTPFMEVFLHPRELFDLPAAVNAALAGELRGDWPVWWRMRLFFLLIHWQAKRPFLPRIYFPTGSHA